MVFKPNNKIIIDKEEHTIRTYRFHKIFDMITIDDYDNINDVFYCADPDTNPQIGKGRIRLTESSIATHCGGTGNQDIVINSLGKFWYIE